MFTAKFPVLSKVLQRFGTNYRLLLDLGQIKLKSPGFPGFQVVLGTLSLVN